MVWTARWVLGLVAVAAVPAAPASAVSVLLGPPDLMAFPTNSPDGCNLLAGSCESLLGNLVPAGPATTLAAPADGTVTSWSMNGVTSGLVTVFLRVARPAGGNDYVSVGITNGISTLPVSASPAGSNAAMRAGDVLVADMTCTDNCQARVYRRAAAAASYGFSDGFSASVPSTFSPVAGQELAYNATVQLDEPVISTLTPASGTAAGGQAIIIDGQHLAVATSVTFDGVPGSIVSGTSTKMAVRTPAHPLNGPVTVAVTTAGGTGTSAFTYTGAADPPAPTTTTTVAQPPPPPPDQVPPTISNVKLSAPSLVAGSSAVNVTYRLSEPATTIVTVQKRTTGVRRGRSCVKRTRRLHRRACTRWVAVKGSIKHADAAGIVKLRFTGRIGGRKLAPGRYRLVITAVDAAGNRSKVGTVQFTVKRPKRTHH